MLIDVIVLSLLELDCREQLIPSQQIHKSLVWIGSLPNKPQCRSGDRRRVKQRCGEVNLNTGSNCDFIVQC